MPKAGMIGTRSILKTLIFVCFLALVTSGCTTTVTPSGIKVYGFYDPTCPRCLKMKPGLDRVGHRYETRLQFVTYDITEPANAKLADRYKITAIPTFIVVDQKGKIVDRLSGGVPLKSLEHFISKNIAKCRTGS